MEDGGQYYLRASAAAVFLSSLSATYLASVISARNHSTPFTSNMPRVIRFDDTCYHALKPTILQIVRGVYADLDPNNCPIAFDACYHFAVLSYEPTSYGAPEPRRIYLIMREGEPEIRDAKVRFVLNVLTNKVHDRMTRAFHMAPEEVVSLLDVVRRFVREALEEEMMRSPVQDEDAGATAAVY